MERLRALPPQTDRSLFIIRQGVGGFALQSLLSRDLLDSFQGPYSGMFISRCTRVNFRLH